VGLMTAYAAGLHPRCRPMAAAAGVASRQRRAVLKEDLLDAAPNPRRTPMAVRFTHL
jgi:hypothetical protein